MGLITDRPTPMASRPTSRQMADEMGLPNVELPQPFDPFNRLAATSAVPIAYRGERPPALLTVSPEARARMLAAYGSPSDGMSLRNAGMQVTPDIRQVRGMSLRDASIDLAATPQADQQAAAPPSPGAIADPVNPSPARQQVATPQTIAPTGMQFASAPQPQYQDPMQSRTMRFIIGHALRYGTNSAQLMAARMYGDAATAAEGAYRTSASMWDSPDKQWHRAATGAEMNFKYQQALAKAEAEKAERDLRIKDATTRLGWEGEDRTARAEDRQDDRTIKQQQREIAQRQLDMQERQASPEAAFIKVYSDKISSEAAAGTDPKTAQARALNDANLAAEYAAFITGKPWQRRESGPGVDADSMLAMSTPSVMPEGSMQATADQVAETIARINRHPDNLNRQVDPNVVLRSLADQGLFVGPDTLRSLRAGARAEQIHKFSPGMAAPLRWMSGSDQDFIPAQRYVDANRDIFERHARSQQ